MGLATPACQLSAEENPATNCSVGLGCIWRMVVRPEQTSLSADLFSGWLVFYLHTQSSDWSAWIIHAVSCPLDLTVRVITSAWNKQAGFFISKLRVGVGIVCTFLYNRCSLEVAPREVWRSSACSHMYHTLLPPPPWEMPISWKPQVLPNGPEYWQHSAHFYFIERLHWLAPLWPVSQSPSHFFSKLSNPREVINGFSSYSSTSLPNYGKAKITESWAWPKTSRGHSPPPSPCSQAECQGWFSKAKEPMMADQLISSHLVPAEALQCQPQITKPLRNKRAWAAAVPWAWGPDTGRHWFRPLFTFLQWALRVWKRSGGFLIWGQPHANTAWCLETKQPFL